MSKIFKNHIKDKDRKTPNKGTTNKAKPNEENLNKDNPNEKNPSEEPCNENPPNGKTSNEDTTKSNPEETNTSDFENSEVTEDTENNDLYKLPFETPFPLEKPFDLRVGNFDSVLDKLRTSATGIGHPKIAFKELAKKVDPDEIIAHALDKLWAKATGPLRKSSGDALLTMFRKNLRPGLIVVVEDKQFRCHAMVLQVLSSFFRQPELAPSQIFQLPSSMVSARAFVAMYRWGLETADTMSSTLLMQVLRAATFFDCQELIGNCWTGISEGTRTPDRALCTYLQGNLMGMRLEENLLERLSSIFLQFAASKEYLYLEADTVQRLLGLSSLAVNSEMEVFLAAIYWLHHKWPQRIKFSYKMMDAIRFDCLPYTFLMCLLKKMDSGPPVLKMLSRTPFVGKKAYKAIRGMRGSRKKLQGRGGDTDRIWIYDRRALHHHTLKCNRVQFLGYDTFVRYLEFLQTAGSNHWLSFRTIDDPEIRCCPLHLRY
ncbi:uncharacterized protein LOC122625021 isoform X2 [Drosophila teissieri]|uniref:uncharacterized protein LOC122625021 isoform X2 n=1 Tax=Drosophila teissieri TaxID=7243 RepID=UPI001CB9E86A|nr:uncharacterized protein LOC122625021 isoform X2 [Drosophila teissieri]XP_043660775.1 uncharacterized protein LOC122625021 isoform X2 [Drosophila teissieri]XP_043660776.1 uncharacterized protein LOC122625021 isoform X2 [Drosophila teissieri]XP_043660777.1 uncharacterized protein LOC122625021 isoform X2 [Drosophila teissieri]